MRHDYDLPHDWNAMTQEEKSRWMTQDRCRRMYMNISEDDKIMNDDLEKELERIQRKAEARGFTVEVER